MQSSYRFGRFEVRAVERQVLDNGKTLPVGARGFDILLALIERRERVVGKDELLDLVWPGLVVEEANVQVQVSLLRRLLGPQVMTTIPGRGYRFAMPLLDERKDLQAADAAVSSPLTVPSGNAGLPAAATRLFGRGDTVSALAHMSLQHRLVTVIGAGGIGKTALALAAAHEVQASHRDGVVWVELAPIADAALLPATVAQALQLPVGRGDAPLPALVAGLKSRHVMLVLDNAEHLLDAVAQLAQAVLAGAPDARLLVTSQARLRIDGERLLRLDSLAVPPSGTSASEALTYGAVALFVDQAQALDRCFSLSDANVDAVVNLCRQLDGIALALKLAVARLPLLGLRGLESQLTHRLQVLGRDGNRDAPPRQQTLRAALDWSYSLLPPLEQAVFRRLGVFAGGFTLELAVTLAGAGLANDMALIDSLANLVDRSLVVVSESDPPRYRLLESAREYAVLELGTRGELDAVQQAHANALLCLFRHADERLWLANEEGVLPHIRPELDNLRAALDWSASRDPQLAVALIGTASGSFVLLGLSHEHRRRSAALESALGSVRDPTIAAKYWLERSHTLAWSAYGQMHDCARKAEALYRTLDEAQGIYLSLSYVVSSGVASAAASLQALDEIVLLDRPEWPPRVRMFRFFAEYNFALYYGDAAAGLQPAQAGLALARAAGAGLWATMFELWIVNSEVYLGKFDAALLRCRAVIARERAHRGGSLLGVSLGFMARILLLQHKLADARVALAELFECSRAAEWGGFRDFVGLSVQLALSERRYVTAARLVGYADQTLRHLGRVTRFGQQMRLVACTTLQAQMDVQTLDRLISEGNGLDEDTAAALALEVDDAVAAID